jgi:arylsulfatase A-like enzyme
MRWCLLLAGASLALVPGPLPAGEAARKPNVVHVLADDLGYGDPRCYHPASRIPTPHLDRQGMRFTDAHTPASVCTPTRYGILTGRYPWRSALKRGVLNGYSPLLIEPGRLTLASLLRRHGYFTACVGKWHLGLGRAGKTDYARALTPGPNAVGFDYFFGIAASLDMQPYVYIENEGVTAAPTGTFAGNDRPRGGAPEGRAGSPLDSACRPARIAPRCPRVVSQAPCPRS